MTAISNLKVLQAFSNSSGFPLSASFYEGESNENLKYFLFFYFFIMDDMVC